MITVLIDTFYLKAAPAGIKTYINQLVYSSKNSSSKKIQYIYSSDSKVKHNKIFLNSKNKIVRWIFHIYYFLWKQIFLPVKCIQNNVDILICPDYVLPFWSLKLNKIVVIHDSLFWDHPHDYSKIWRYCYLKLINLGINKKTLIVTDSYYSKKSLIKRFKKNKIHVIYPSVKEMNHNIIAKRKNIVHIGSFERRKNLLILLKAFALIKKNKINKDLKLVLSGSTNFFGQNMEYLKVKKFISENKLESEVTITGYISDLAIKKLYETAFIYTFPSLKEGFGLPIVESFSARVPVICSDIEVFKEIGNDAVLNFQKNNHKDLASKIELLINSDELRLELIKKGLERLKTFSNENFINSYEKLFKLLK
jgi:glycosyltransferase involved in cell wall biosynthesis